jgi:uncharacterized membrane protein YdjX (TVP38/TMEM64 family)
VAVSVFPSPVFFPGTPLTLLAGATLGTGYGFLVSLIGNIFGATLAFFIARYVLRDYVSSHIIKRYPKIQEYEKRFFEDGLRTVILLRLIPLFPFNVLNYALGVTRVRTKDYIIGTTLGIIPGTLAYVYFGDALRMLSVVNIVIALSAIIGLIYIGKKYEKR